MTEIASYYQNQRREVAQFLPAAYSRVLEIGCGGGHFRSNLSLPHEYWGIELSPQAAERAATTLDRVLVGSFDSNFDALPQGYFDLVVCNDVIEHLPDHDSFLSRIKQKLTTNGCLMGSIPNVRHLFNLIELMAQKDWHYRDEGILDRTHLRFFTRKSLLRAFESNSYAVEMLEGINVEYQRGGRLRRTAYSVLAQLLGSDVKYLQFGFRVRPAGR